MNKNIFQGDWKMLKGKVKEQWGKLTDDDLTQINGKREQLTGALQKKYGLAKDAADKEIQNWEKKCCEHCKEEEKQQEHVKSGKH